MSVVSLNDLVGGGQQRFRNCEAERLGGFEVDGQLDFYSLLDRQIGWFLAFENAPGIDANLVVRIVGAAAIADQAAGQDELTDYIDRGQRVAGRQRRELFRASAEEGTVGDQDRTNVLLRNGCEGRFEIAIG